MNDLTLTEVLAWYGYTHGPSPRLPGGRRIYDFRVVLVATMRAGDAWTWLKAKGLYQ